jgi:hypothetical protein
MRICDFKFSNGLILSYALAHTQTTEMWLEMLGKMLSQSRVHSDFNHRHGFASAMQIKRAIGALIVNCQVLGLKLEPMERENWQDVLNRLHIHFPERQGIAMTTQEFRASHKMNLLIHWLEYELSNLFNRKQQYIFNLDFNHQAWAYNLKKTFPEPEMIFYSESRVWTYTFTLH